jgi:hypothetical protein
MGYEWNAAFRSGQRVPRAAIRLAQRSVAIKRASLDLEITWLIQLV